jgi:hypothetical protein
MLQEPPNLAQVSFSVWGNSPSQSLITSFSRLVSLPSPIMLCYNHICHHSQKWGTLHLNVEVVVVLGWPRGTWNYNDPWGRHRYGQQCHCRSKEMPSCSLPPTLSLPAQPLIGWAQLEPRGIWEAQPTLSTPVTDQTGKGRGMDLGITDPGMVLLLWLC